MKPTTIVPAKPKELPVSLTLRGVAVGVEKAVGSDDHVGESMVQTSRVITEAHDKIHATYTAVMGNKLNTPLANLKAARTAINKIVSATLKRIDEGGASVTTAIEALTAQTQPKPPRDAMEALAHQEVRRALLAMPEAKRARTVEQAINEGDDAFAIAAVTGSPLLTGLGKAEQAALRELWRNKRHPDKVARLVRLQAGYGEIDRATALFLSWSRELFAEDNAAIAAAEESDRLAREALNNVA
jgi:hypothetical protein